MTYSSCTETWVSGRNRITANDVGDKTPREFESLRLRQPKTEPPKGRLCSIHSPLILASYSSRIGTLANIIRMSNSNIVITVIIVGGYFLFAHTAAAPVTETPVTTTSSTDTTGSTTAMVVTYTNSGFSPSTFTIKLGTTVHFVNNSSHGMWVAVGNHPTHTTYDGTTQQQHCSNGVNTNGSFDECTAVSPGLVYSFTFNRTGTFTFHNHIQASDGGTVTITP